MTDLFRGAFLSMETGRRVWGRAGGELEVRRRKGGKSFVPLSRTRWQGDEQSNPIRDACLGVVASNATRDQIEPRL